MFKALFFEGFARPFEGVRRVIRLLTRRFREVGGERRMKCGVRRIVTEGGRAVGVELDSGEVIGAGHILSSAGAVETDRLIGAGPPEAPGEGVGRLSFVETITVLAGQPADYGWEETIVFFNDGERFDYARPEGLVDPRSGVICFPNNYRYDGERALPEGIWRITALASHPLWTALEQERYAAEKAHWFEVLQRQARRFLPAVDEARLQADTLANDMFTPRTIEHYTGHLGGAVYGAPDKRRRGETALENVYLIGTDQGFLGITGAMLSGITIANLRILAENK
jgi:phytoene dehydrogenase-like protein